MANFTFLKNRPEYALFATAAIEAERVYHSSRSLCATGCRKAMELAVKWVYAADENMELPARDQLTALLIEPCFRWSVDKNVYRKLLYIRDLGNTGTHENKTVSADAVLYSLKALFEFIQWIDYTYGKNDYVQRTFEEKELPAEKVALAMHKIKQQQKQMDEKDAVIEALKKQIEEMSAMFTAQKAQNQQEESRIFEAEDISEWETRKRFIDLDLELMGWKLEGVDMDVQQEYKITDMMGIEGQIGYADYVLFGRDGKPLAVVEAKRTSKDPKIGERQAELYAQALEREFGRMPMLFTTNGFETHFWELGEGTPRQVSCIFSKNDLQRLMNRRTEKKDLYGIVIDDKITDRYYQKEAIRAVCDHILAGHRKSLLVMATGTGKTRTASSLVDVLSRGGYVTNVLFLADRTALVKQAKEDFKKYLPDLSLCNLCSNKDDRSARIVFSTYPTMLNAIDSAKTQDGQPLFTPAHFDLIIIDESHRSIFRKYRTIFAYFDAMLLGLTATPKTDVDRNTYDFFETEKDMPTYAYDYETAVEQDKVLVPYYTYEVKTKFMEDGIHYDDLSEEDQKRYEDDFAEDDSVPDFIPSVALNQFIFNEKTVDTVLQDLMERGIKVEGGDRIGKTIIFAQNKNHAEFIVKRFNALYPQYNGEPARRIICDDAYAQTLIDDFRQSAKMPDIAVSVDMMDTGIDVPECVNLVFFKKIRSKTKFWQMIGRGTRLAPELNCMDAIDGEYTGKRRFLIFDYCGNFEFFRQEPNGFAVQEVKTLSENLYCKKVRLLYALQDAVFAEQSYQEWRKELADGCHAQAAALSEEIVSVRMRRQYVERYKKREVFDALSETDKEDLMREIAPLVYTEDTDEAAKRFDNFMYGMILAQIEKLPSFKRAKTQLYNIAVLLETKKSGINQVKEKLPLLRQIQEEGFLDGCGTLTFEKIRKELRELMVFLIDDKIAPIMTDLTDPILEQTEGGTLPPADPFHEYRRKVNRYVEEHGDTLAIYKLTHNIPLSQGDYIELERILTEELGTKEDYQREFGDTPFGLLIRRVAKLDHEAVMQAFSKFINDAALNQKQIAFVRKIIAHVEQHGYMESAAQLQQPPFDKPVSFLKLFDAKTAKELVDTINGIRENAVKIKAQ